MKREQFESLFEHERELDEIMKGAGLDLGEVTEESVMEKYGIDSIED